MLFSCAELGKEGNKTNWKIWIGMAQLIALAHDYFVCFVLELKFGHIVLSINLIL
jgi:hypothetical protein